MKWWIILLLIFCYESPTMTDRYFASLQELWNDGLYCYCIDTLPNFKPRYTFMEQLKLFNRKCEDISDKKRTFNDEHMRQKVNNILNITKVLCSHKNIIFSSESFFLRYFPVRFITKFSNFKELSRKVELYLRKVWLCSYRY